MSWPCLYFIADSSFGIDNLPLLSEQALSGGARMLQLRAKDTPEDKIIATAKILQQKAAEHKAILIINDNPHIAKEVGCAGVHLGQQDMSPLEAKEILGDKAIIGATIHSYKEALNLPLEQVDYVGLGAIFGGGSKPQVPLMHFALMKEIIKYIRLETDSYCAIFAIGGINLTNMDKLKEIKGIEGIAVIGAIANADNPAKITSMICDKLSKWK